jgi:hypothetical protein
MDTGFRKRSCSTKKLKRNGDSTFSHFALTPRKTARPAAPRAASLPARPRRLSARFPVVNILSSTYGSVRADTGLCQRHVSFTTARDPACPQFEGTDD